ncbi:ABC transporter substrate-binding protein [Oscillospiraceae bacterium MB08-C2-2]|nr:ABC transporter substrate-binding protein [Oscillospiraceae bacterium MB08-C2-2]
MKKIFASLLTLALVLGSLAGCGGSGSSAASSQAASTGTDASAPAQAGTAQAAYKVGGTGPLTGGAAIYGIAAKNGAQIAVEEINALGGIQFELRYEDDEHDAEKAVNAYNQLKDWGMQISLGSVTSTPCAATAAETFADRIFALTPSASATAVIDGKDNMYQMCFTDPNQGLASAQYISDKKLGTKIAVIYKNDDVYSSGIYSTFESKAKELGLEIVSATTFTEDSQNDFSVQLTDAKNKGADLVFLPIYYTPASLIFQQAKAMDFAPKFFGVDGMDGILALENFDTSLAENVMLLTPFNADSTDELTTSFVAKYKEKFGETPNQFAADGYDCIYAYKAALEAAGATPDMSAQDICEKLVATFPTISVDGLTGQDMTWAASGEVSKSPKGMVIQSGAYVGMD